MDERERRILSDAAREWDAKGYLVPGARAKIAAELVPGPRADVDAPGLGAAVLYALGGVLLAAAFVAFGVLQDIDEDVMAHLAFGIGAALLVGGLVLERIKLAHFGDAASMAGILLVAMSGLPGRHEAYAWLGCLLAAGLLWWRFQAPVLPHVAAALVPATLAVAIADWQTRPQTATLFGAAVVLLIAIVAYGRLLKHGGRHATSFVATGAALVTAIYWISESVRPTWTGGYEVLVAAIFVPLMIGAILLRERGVAYASALVVAGDAVFFAFDVGDVAGGVISLIIVGAAFLVAATIGRKKLQL